MQCLSCQAYRSRLSAFDVPAFWEGGSPFGGRWCPHRPVLLTRSIPGAHLDFHTHNIPSLHSRHSQQFDGHLLVSFVFFTLGNGMASVTGHGFFGTSFPYATHTVGGPGSTPLRSSGGAFEKYDAVRLGEEQGGGKDTSVLLWTLACCSCGLRRTMKMEI